jgi:hypothetical protein
VICIAILSPVNKREPGLTVLVVRIQVQSGLRDGERVVLSPPESLKDGHAVKLAEHGAPCAIWSRSVA